jgi:hypothetical protein
MALPGDQIARNATSQETRAITIDAPLEKVWPWVAQTGQDRGGFYSYDLLENIVGCEMPTTDVLRPEKQQWKLGDKLWMYPADKAEGVGFATLRTYIPGNALGFGTRAFGTSMNDPEDGSWAFVLLPEGREKTRLLLRGRGPTGRTLLGRAFNSGIFEPAHFAMERRMMIGIKQLAEGDDRGHWENHLMVGLWTIVFFMFVGSVWRILRSPNFARGLVSFLISAALFQYLSLGQPPVWVGAILVGITMFLWWRLGQSGAAMSGESRTTKARLAG